ncbi:MAG: helix-turn-helix transcriptional regulator [Myxococcota bacterium]
MSDTSIFPLIAPLLKRAARNRGVTYRELGAALGLSESAMKKVLNAADCSMNRLATLCDLLGLDLTQVIEVAKKQPIEETELTPRQQTFLLQNPLALRVFWKVFAEGASAPKASRELGISRRQLHAVLRQLDARGLLRYEGRGRVDVGRPEHQIWAGDGPLMRVVREEWTEAVLRRAYAHPNGDGYRTSIRYVPLTAASMARFDASITALLDDLARQGAVERSTNARVSHFSVVVATVPESILDCTMSENSPPTS